MNDCDHSRLVALQHKLYGATMRYEVVEDAGEWIVRSEGIELARFGCQDEALNDVARRLRAADASQTSGLVVRYQPRQA